MQLLVPFTIGERPLAVDFRTLAFGSLAVAIAYFLCAKFGFRLAFATKQVTAVWPPTGLAVTAYLIFGARIWPGVYLGAFASNAVSDEPLLTAAGIAIGNTAAGFLGLRLLQTAVQDFKPQLNQVNSVLAWVLCAAAAGCAVSASNGVFQLALGGLVPWNAAPSVWSVWWVGDAMGVLLFGSFLMAWIWCPSPRYLSRHWVELGVGFCALTTLCFFAFARHASDSGDAFRLEYAVFPFIIWIALRFSQREVASAIVLVCGTAIWGAIHDHGPFAVGSQDHRLMLLEVFMAATALTGLVLGAVTAERMEAELALKAANDELEMKVQARTAELAATNRELARKNEEVEAFVYIVSHDLRSPLVNLQGFSRELEASCRQLQEVTERAAMPHSIVQAVSRIIKDDIAGALHFIVASTNKFERLIDSLLTLSRYGRQEYELRELDIRAVVTATTDAAQAQIDRCEATILIGDLPLAMGDSTAIGQVFSNLIGNAMKYALPTRPVEIVLAGVTEQDMVHYWVRDNGAGISDSAQRRLFQVFQRFHPKLAEGEGMGLAIVKRIVERHGGRVWAESQEGVGTTFHLTLPSARPAKEVKNER